MEDVNRISHGLPFLCTKMRYSVDFDPIAKFSLYDLSYRDIMTL